MPTAPAHRERLAVVTPAVPLRPVPYRLAEADVAIEVGPRLRLSYPDGAVLENAHGLTPHRVGPCLHHAVPGDTQDYSQAKCLGL